MLSDSNSPFICLVAVDSRIAVKCIETEMGATLLKANVNGHEYMRKIINLPFCIPEVCALVPTAAAAAVYSSPIGVDADLC